MNKLSRNFIKLWRHWTARLDGHRSYQQYDTAGVMKQGEDDWFEWRPSELPADQTCVSPTGDLGPLPMVLYWRQPIIGTDDRLGTLRAVLVVRDTKIITHLVLSYRVRLRQHLKLIPFGSVEQANRKRVQVRLRHAHLKYLPDFHLQRHSDFFGDEPNALDCVGPWLALRPEEQSSTGKNSSGGEVIPLGWRTTVFTQDEPLIGRVTGCLADPTCRTLTHLLVFRELIVPRWVAIPEADILWPAEPEVVIRLKASQVRQLPTWHRA